MHDTYINSTHRHNRKLDCVTAGWKISARLITVVLAITTTLAAQSMAYADAQLHSVVSAVPASSGMLLLSAADQGAPGRWREAVLLDTQIDLNVQGLLADMTVRQQFTNDSADWLEGKYVFPLPDKAAIRGLIVNVGERVIKGQIMPREQALQTYTQARDAGQVSSLVEQQRPNLFTVKVATIAPGDKVTVQLDVMLPVAYDSGRFSLTLPTTLTPRYNNTDTPDAYLLSAPAANASQIRGPRLSLSARIEPVDSISSISSSSHTLIRQDQTVSLSSTAMDRDVNLSWFAPQADSPRGKVFVSEHRGERYLQMLLVPPSKEPDFKDSPPRELILVIDTSGSMAGQSIRAAQQALQFALDGLNARDFFNIIAFDSTTRSLFNTAKPVSTESIASARKFVRRLQADGGTEMRPAITRALATPNADRLRQIVFITDGAVGYEDELLRQIKRDLGDSRLFTIAIGTAPNSYFMHKAAEVGRGVHLAIIDTADVQTAINTLLDQLQHPVITDLSVQFIGGHGEAYPNATPDLYAKQPVLVVARIDASVTNIVVAGFQANSRWKQELPIPSAPHAINSAHRTERDDSTQRADNPKQ